MVGGSQDVKLSTGIFVTAATYAGGPVRAGTGAGRAGYASGIRPLRARELNTAKLGKLYDATAELDGPSCGDEGNCDEGDQCDNEATHRCRVVLSALSRD